MTLDPEKYSRAVPVPVIHHPEVAFDMTGGRGADPGMTRVVPVPVIHHPEIAFDMTAPRPTEPRLALNLRVRPEAPPADVTRDLLSVYAALNRYEVRLGGGGLTPDEARSDLSAAGGEVRLTLTPVDPAGAADRLAKLAEAVNGDGPAVPRELLTGRSFVACRVELPPAA